MGSGISSAPYATVEEALAAGRTQDEVDAFFAAASEDGAWKLDMIGKWTSGDDEDDDCVYHLRLILQEREMGEALWSGTAQDKPFWHSGSWGEPQLPDDYTSALLSVSPGDRGNPSGIRAGGAGFNTPNELILRGQGQGWRKGNGAPGLVGDEIPIGGIIQWFLSKESGEAELARLAAIRELADGKSGAGNVTGLISERSFEFVCGLRSPSTGRLVIGGTRQGHAGYAQQRKVSLGVHSAILQAASADR